MIVAVSKNLVIGKDDSLPWRLPEDLKTFKALTMGGVLYVGKKTANTLPPLKGREVKVLNREGYPSLKTIKEVTPDAWIIGGAAIYNAALELGVVDKVYLSLVDRDYDGDTFFPVERFKAPEWSLVSETIIREGDPVVRLQEWLKVKV